jgi:hypothetical protein
VQVLGSPPEGVIADVTSQNVRWAPIGFLTSFLLIVWTMVFYFSWAEPG